MYFEVNNSKIFLPKEEIDEETIKQIEKMSNEPTTNHARCLKLTQNKRKMSNKKTALIVHEEQNEETYALDKITFDESKLEEDGKKLYKTNPFYTKLANLMEHPEFKDIFKQLKIKSYNQFYQDDFNEGLVAGTIMYIQEKKSAKGTPSDTGSFGHSIKLVC